MQEDFAILHAEVAALQAVLIAVFRALAAEDAAMRLRLVTAFDEAETVLEGLASRPGQGDTLATCLEAMRILEQIRRGAIRPVERLEARDCNMG